MQERTQPLSPDLGPMVECEEMVTDHGSPAYRRWANSAHLTQPQPPPLPRELRDSIRSEVEEHPTLKLQELPREGTSTRPSPQTSRHASVAGPKVVASRIATPIAQPKRRQGTTRSWLVILVAPAIGAALGYLLWLGFYAR